MSATRTLQVGARLAGRLRAGSDAQAVRLDAHRPFRFLFSGDSAMIAGMRAALLAPSLGVEPSLEAPRLLETLSRRPPATVPGPDVRCVVHLAAVGDPDPGDEAFADLRAPVVRVLVDPDGAAGRQPARGGAAPIVVTSLDAAQLRERVFPAVAACCRGVEVAVGVRLPAMRDAVCAALIDDAARGALKIAAASAVVDQVPVLGFVVGALAAAGDTVAISGVQLRLLLRIGAVFGRDPGVGAAWELVPVVGGGLGWRALSRELAGFVPVAGVVIKGAIAYAGTVVVGEGAAFYYRNGRRMSPADAQRVYARTRRAAVERARDLVGRLRGRR